MDAIICDECLGTEDDIRMIKVPDGAECKLCTLTYDLYHFKKDKRSNTIVKTIICPTCANQRNVCQCCMLDMLWHIPIDERDQLLSLIKGYNITTKEATNEMMKRFLVLKKGNKQIGGAAMMVQGDENDLIRQMMDTLERERLSKGNRLASKNEKPSLQNIDKFANVNIRHILDRLPLKESFCKDTTSTTRFFIYNVDLSLAEWKIDDKISQIVENSDWKDPHPLSMMINHKATCGCINFKDLDLSQKFINSLISQGDVISCQGKQQKKQLQRGILKIDHFNLYVVPWVKDNFTQNSFGNNTKEYIKLSLTLRNIISTEMKPQKNMDTKGSEKAREHSKHSKKVKRHKKNNGRVTSAFEL